MPQTQSLFISMHSIPPMDPPSSAEECLHVVEGCSHTRIDQAGLAAGKSVEGREEVVLWVVEEEYILEA